MIDAAGPVSGSTGMLSTKTRIISERLSSIMAGGSPTRVSQAATNSACGMWVSKSSLWDAGSDGTVRTLVMHAVRTCPMSGFTVS